MKVFWVTVASSVFRTQKGRNQRSHAVPEHVLIPQDLLDDSAPDCFQQGLFQQLQRPGKRDALSQSAVHQQTVLCSSSRMSYTLPHTSGTPRSTSRP